MKSGRIVGNWFECKTSSSMFSFQYLSSKVLSSMKSGRIVADKNQWMMVRAVVRSVLCTLIKHAV